MIPPAQAQGLTAGPYPNLVQTPVRPTGNPVRQTENVGYFGLFLQRMTAPPDVPTNSLEEKTINPVNGTWSGLLCEIARFLLAEKVGVAENAPLFLNLSLILKQVLLTIGMVNLNANQAALLDDPAFIRHLIANLLEIFNHDFTPYDFEAEPGSKQGQDLRNKLNKIFDVFMVSAGLDLEHVKDKPGLVHMLYPGAFARFGLGVLSYVKGLPAINRSGFETLFVESAIAILKPHRKLETKSQDKILSQNEGLLELIDFFVKTKLLNMLKTGVLSFKYPFLKSKKNAAFLTSILNKALFEQGSEGTECPDSLVIDNAWKSIENQLKMTIQAIFAVLLTPKPGQKPAERRDALLIGTLDRLGEHTEGLNKRVLGIKKMKSLELEQALLSIKGPFEGRAKALLDSRGPHREDEIALLLKKIEYVQAAQSVLKNELNPQKFAGFIPKQFNVEDLFQGLYEFIGETALELHEQKQYLEQAGEQALNFIRPVAGLSKFVEELMTGLILTLEEKAEKNEIHLGYGKFLDELFSSLLKVPEEIMLDASVERAGDSLEDSVDFDDSQFHGEGKNLAKEEVKALAKNILMIVVKKAIDSDMSKGCAKEEAFSNLVNRFVKSTLEGFTVIGESCTALAEKSTPEKLKAVQQLVTKLGVKKFKVKNTDEQLVAKFRQLLVYSLSRDLINHLMPEELFNSLLPPMFKKWGLWAWVVEGMIAPYLEGISDKVETFKRAEFQKDSSEADRLKLKGDCVNLRVLLKPLTAKACEFISGIKFAKLLSFDRKESKLSRINFGILDDLFGKALQQGGQITQLVELVLPRCLESLLAFHLNSHDEKTSQERATELLWFVLEVTNDCYNRIRRLQKQEQPLASFEEAFNNEMNAALTKVMDRLIPQTLWDVHVPKEFNQLIDRNQIGQLLLGYIKEGYAHSTNMKKMVSEGKIHLQNEEARRGAEAEVGLHHYIEKKVISGLEEAAKQQEDEEESIQWIRGVIRHLLHKEKEAQRKPLTKIAINGAYILFSKLLSRGLSALSPVPVKSDAESAVIPVKHMEAEECVEDLSLIGKIAKLIPEIRDAYYQLSDLKTEQKCSSFPQITIENSRKYLSLGKENVKNHEEIEQIFEMTEKKEDIIVFNLSIKNAKTKESRQVSVDLVRFIYWQVSYRVLNELISDMDRKALIPTLMHPILTKEVLAEFAVPYVHAARQIQVPLQANAKAGKKLIDEISKEDPAGNLKGYIDKKMIKKMHAFLNEIAHDSKPIDQTLPAVLDKLLKDVLRTESNKNIKIVRNALVKRVIYLLLNELLQPVKWVDREGTASLTKASASNLVQKLHEIIAGYGSSKKNPAEIAQKVVNAFISEATWNEIFTGPFRDLVPRQALVDSLENPVKEICCAIDILDRKQAEAMEQIKELDQQAQGNEYFGGGLEKAIILLCNSIDKAIDSTATSREKFFESVPLLLEVLAKEALNDRALVQLLKDLSHAMVLIIAAGMFQREEGQIPEEQFLIILARLIDCYRAEDPKTTATAWLQILLPEELRKEILPPFLHETLTHAFIAENVFGMYLAEIFAYIHSLGKIPQKKEKNITRIQQVVKRNVAEYSDPDYSAEGVSGFGGFVKPLETILAAAATGSLKTGSLKEGENFEGVSGTLEKCIDGAVVWALTLPKVKNMLHKQFLTEGLIDALPELADPEGKLKIENDFERQSGELVCEILFPNGAIDLPLPKGIQESAFDRIQEVVADMTGRLVHRDQRLLTCIQCFGVNPNSTKVFNAMEEQLKTSGHLKGKEKIVERMFKSGLISLVMQKIEQNVAKGWPEPFRRLPVKFVKVIAQIALKVAINQQVWKFVSDAKNDVKFRRFIWKFLNYAKIYEPKGKGEEVLNVRLREELNKSFEKIGLFAGIRRGIALVAADFIQKQNFVTLID